MVYLKIIRTRNECKMAQNLSTITNGLSIYPFGMLMSDRSYSSPAYRYGFNGKEKIDEINGDGNSYDFGGRIYDSRLGRWLSLDPLQAKYPDLSPYNFCANNPVCFVDFDGKDFGIVIDHEKKTITIVANFYVTQGKTNDIAATNSGVQPYSDASGKFYLSAHCEDGKEIPYTINFKINVIESKDPIKSAEKDPFGNSVIIDDKKVDELEKMGHDKKEADGITVDGKNIYLRTQSGERTKVHEIGHTFGLRHFSWGFMLHTLAIHSDLKVRLSYVTDMLRFAKTPSGGGDAIAIASPNGTCADQVNSGETIPCIPKVSEDNTLNSKTGKNQKPVEFEYSEVKKSPVK